MNLQRSGDTLVTASNLISLGRMVLTIPIAIAIWYEYYNVAFITCWIAALTDWIDGYVARKTNTVSEWGKIIDPVADKVLVAVVMTMLLLKSLLPLWFVAAVVFRDIVIMAGAVLARQRTDVILPSLLSGKLAVTAIALTGVVAMVNVGEVRDGLIIVSSGLMGLSLWQYGVRLHGLFR